MAAKAEQILQIDPQDEIIFKGPFTDVVTSHLKLSNPTDRQICFKVKTTAPKQYCVRPNSGFIPAKGLVNVAVMLQPFNYNAEEKSNHKFMIQSAYVPEGESSLDAIWKNTQSSELMDSKLKVLFQLPENHQGGEDAWISDKTSSLKQTPQKASNNTDGELRRYLSENKGLQGKINQLEQENELLRNRLRTESASGHQKSGNFGDTSVIQGSEFKIIHVIISAIIALFIGLIFGKIF